MNEIDKFMTGIEEPTTDDPFAPVTTTEEVTTTTDTDEDNDLKPHNRRERRLQARLQAEREAGIQMAARLQALTEAKTERNSTTSDDYLANVERIYGNDSPEAREATELLKTSLKRVEESAYTRAIEAMREERQREAQAVQEAEATLDRMVEDIEDEFDVDLSGNEKARTDFFKLLQKMSPKDRDGNIIAYADHAAVWEEYQERTKRPADNTAKNLAARSMATSSGANSTNATKDAEEQYLREIGIL